MNNLVKKISVFSVLVFAITLCFAPISVNAKTIEAKSKIDLTKSILNKYPNTPEVNQLKNKIKSNAKSMQVSNHYCKIAQTPYGNKIVETYDNESAYKAERQKEEVSNKSHSRHKRDLPASQSFGWIKLTLECWGTGGNNFMACAGYEWLTAPICTFSDVFTIGHDATCTFSTQSCWGMFITPYQSGNKVRQDSTVLRSSSNNFKSSTSGAGYKFDLKGNVVFSSNSEDHRFPFGLLYVNGTVTSRAGANLQVSYGHTQAALSFSANSAIKFKPNGALNFNIIGSKQTVTTGDRYKY